VSPAAAAAAEHLQRGLLGAAVAVLALAERSLTGGVPRLVDRHPFLGAYVQAIALASPQKGTWDAAAAWWREDVAAWEQAHRDILPLLTVPALTGVPARRAYAVAALPAEDARFAAVIGELQPASDTGGFSAGTIAAALDAPGERHVLRAVELLLRQHLLHPLDPERPNSGLVVAPGLWRVVRDGADERMQARLPVEGVLDHWDSDRRNRLVRACRSLVAGNCDTLVVRAVPGADAAAVVDAGLQAAGRGAHVLGIEELLKGPGAAVAAARGRVPVAAVSAAPGATTASPRPAWCEGPLVVLLGGTGGLEPGPDRRVHLCLDRSSRAERRRFWGVRASAADAEVLADAFLLPDGHLRRIAADSAAAAAVDARAVDLEDLRSAADALGRHTLETRASPVDSVGLRWDDVVLAPEVRGALQALERRCRLRERVLPAVRGAGSTGVRVLLLGPSGVGKTLAASVLAAQLGRSAYRVDLAAVVDKYVGETEKNLDAVLSAAEQLDCVLIVDEGDSLLGARTDGATANDRYANLETNYLLQRLESYRGIIIVTSNAGDRIDPAFARRMDATITLSRPRAAERLAIWRLHLDPAHVLTAPELDRLAGHRLTGGAIRNAARHAQVLAHEAGRPVDAVLAEAGVEAEHRKAGHLRAAPATAVQRAGAQRRAFLSSRSRCRGVG
jgi:hypothetical protein